MRLPRFVLALSLAAAGGLLGVASLRADTPQMSAADVKPGMVGIGHTVFAGTRVEEFKAHILGVIENVIGTQRNLILAKLEGGPLAETGVIAGMSGSPVYIDGKLIGAVSSFRRKDELAELAKLGDMGAGNSEFVVALDGVAVVVNPANRVDKLSIHQLQGLFSGKITDWPERTGSRTMIDGTGRA